MVGQTVSGLRIDKEFHSLIPPLSQEERAGLEESIKAEGCRDALVAWAVPPDSDVGCECKPPKWIREEYLEVEAEYRDGNESWKCEKCGEFCFDTDPPILIDGHNRHEICTRLDKPFRTIEKTFADRDAAMLWMIDNQRHRRNVSEIDRIALAKAKGAIVARIAKTNLKTPTGGVTSAKLPKSQPPIDTRKILAKEADVGERTFDAGKLILEAAQKGEIKPEVVDDVRRGRKAIHRVAKDIKENRQRAARKEKRIEAAKTAPAMDGRIVVGDFRKNADKVADGSVSLIFTDPPYDREASKMLPALAEFAASKLADGGSLILYVGQTQIPAALDAIRPHLRYWWTIACVHAGGATVMREYGIRAGWKAVLWFVKGTRDDNSVIVSDVMSGGEEKSHHDWQQAQSEAAYWIEKLCPRDGLVCDPFLGGGTTAAAAKAAGREWIGFEIDQDTAKIASARVA